ncbi:response regulator transcription factor [Qingshengfaniella alkalisoli]|uniref:Response regulator n=1 Tax=Qingshengfaniella alkalisoli TaxID=2599296 RepID=A0A5B8IRC1_9RHOB|nr:response regulator [Qingshengfaniella alkalisoli]QDY68174.1 response regulator [Qingshengfaniella alkalisoli]
MSVLIVESNPELARLWQRHLERQGRKVVTARTQHEAINMLQSEHVSIIVLDVVLEEGSALAVADYASYRYPDVRVVFVSSSNFFSDGSIFNHSANACAYIPTSAPPDDLAALVDHYEVHL